MTLASRSEIRVRGRLRAIVLVWLSRFVLAFLVAYPLAKTVAAEITQFPLADASLFQAGGFHLLETLRVARPQITAALEAASVTGIVVSLAGLVPLAALMVALNYDPRSLGAVPWIARTVICLPRFVLLSGMTVLTQAIAVFVVATLVVQTSSAARGFLSEHSADWVAAVALALGASVVVLLGILEDLARAAVIRSKKTAMNAVSEAGTTMLRNPGRVLAAWSVPAALSIAVIVAAAFAVGGLHVERAGAWRTFVVFVLHQGVVLALVTLRAAWLARALRFAARESG